jgi:hypothetical protein
VFRTSAVDWILAKDKHGRPIREIVPMLVDRLAQPDCESAEELWYLVAEAECKRYFLEQCQRYRCVKEDIFSDKVADAFRYCLRDLSVGQVWHVIYYVIRDLAALSQEKSYARQHVYNMIPGSIRRFADNKLSNKREVRPWSRPNLHKEAWITSILFDTVLRDGNMLFETLTGNSVAA